MIFTYSIKDGHLSADNWAISHGTWHLTSQGWLYNDSYVQNAMEETCTATDRVETAPGDKTPTDTVHRLAKNLADALNGAAGSGQWQDVPVK